MKWWSEGGGVEWVGRKGWVDWVGAVGCVWVRMFRMIILMVGMVILIGRMSIHGQRSWLGQPSLPNHELRANAPSS